MLRTQSARTHQTGTVLNKWLYFQSTNAKDKNLKQYLREIFEVRKDVHMSEWVYSYNRTVRWSFLDMKQRVAEFITVCMKEVYRPWEEERNIVMSWKPLLHSDAHISDKQVHSDTNSPFSLISCRATSCWNFSKLSVSSLVWNRMRKGIPSSVSSWRNRQEMSNTHQ